jgi:positive regulator of sigma E activity
MADSLIKHSGIVKNKVRDQLEIALINVSACSACHAKSLCNVSETDNKVIEIMDPKNLYHEGDRVSLLFSETQGIKALLLAYVYPFLVLMAVLISLWVITENEALSAGVALGSLAPYYLILALFREKWKKEFEIRLEKPKN